MVVPAAPVVMAETEQALKPSQRKLLQALASEEFREAGASFTELWKTAEVSDKTATHTLPWLVERGYAQHIKKGDPYFITELGEEALGEEPTFLPQPILEE